jgi:hypothetical protein
MAAPLKAGIPPDLDLNANFVIQFAAISPTDGSAITGVTVSEASLLVDNLGGGDLTTGFDVGPIEWLHLPDNLFSTPGG